MQADLSELTTACAEFLRDRHGWEVPADAGVPGGGRAHGHGRCAGRVRRAWRPGRSPRPRTRRSSRWSSSAVARSCRRRWCRPPVGGPWTSTGSTTRSRPAHGRCCCATRTTRPGGCSNGRSWQPWLTIVDRHGAWVSRTRSTPLRAAGRVPTLPYASVSDTAASHTVTLTSASKAWNLAGLKCAQVVTSNHADSARQRRLRVRGGGTDAARRRRAHGGLHLGSCVVGRAGRVPRRQPAPARRARGVRAARRRVARPEATFLAWLDLAGTGLDDPRGHLLRHGGVAVSDGPPFGAGNEAFVRLNFGTSRGLLERIVVAMGAALGCECVRHPLVLTYISSG